MTSVGVILEEAIDVQRSAQTILMISVPVSVGGNAVFFTGSKFSIWTSFLFYKSVLLSNIFYKRDGFDGFDQILPFFISHLYDIDMLNICHVFFFLQLNYGMYGFDEMFCLLKDSNFEVLNLVVPHVLMV